MATNTPRFLWALVFFILGFVLFAVFIGAVLPWAFREEQSVLERKVIFAALMGLTCFIGLPILARILCRRGVLPGTRSVSVHTPSGPEGEFRKLLGEHRKRNS